MGIMSRRRQRDDKLTEEQEANAAKKAAQESSVDESEHEEVHEESHEEHGHGKKARKSKKGH